MLFEAGIGASSSGWELIFDRVAAFATVIAYDRVGYGGSGEGEASPGAALLDLEEVLGNAGAGDPLVLVGHSWGGVLSRLYAAAHAERVAAVVLVDATHEGITLFTHPAMALLNRVAFAAQVRRAKRGRLRRSLEAGKGRLGTMLAGLPASMRNRLLDELSSPGTWEQAGREMRTVAPALRSLSPEMPAVPVVAVVGTGGGKAERRERAMIRSAYDAWLPTLDDGRLIEAPNSGHAVPQQDPDLLVEILRGLVEEMAARRVPSD
ncbi:alpha/beta hydrolase [Nonomuraea rosea]|uniref:Alpha/beta hydrolase n=1 Tax=Nonomuraea rosea TaxID=638574 RepID=A0ABP6ZD77_9ACTN